VQVEVNVVLTLVVAIAVLLLGQLIVAHVGFLNHYSIPEPVVGGLIAAVLITALRLGVDTRISFDMSLQSTLLLAFFSTIGLSADVWMLAKCGTRLVILLVVVTVFLILQNALMVGAAIALYMNLLVGSVTMSGGHGTSATYAKLFGEVNNVQGAMEIAMACATFGLVTGGIIGGPVAERLIKRHNLRGAFPVMGRNYDAAVIAAGHCGFGLGATPTAIANLQAVTGRHGNSALAFLLIPIIGAFLIDITNAVMIQGFLTLPQFGF
jgi:ESS family glutamate:Na+ symporter